MPRRPTARLLIGLAVMVVALLGAGALPVLADQPGERPSPSSSPAPSITPSSSPAPSPPAGTSTTPTSPPNPGRTTSPSPSGMAHGEVGEAPRADGATEERSARQAEQAATVTIVDDEFSPAQLTVTVGATVVWTHRGRHPHTVTADDRAFDSGTLERGQTFSVTFDEVGRVPYHCQIHGAPGSGMFGVVIVQAAPEQAGDQESLAPGSDALARTGLDPIPLWIAALALAIVGLVILRLSRRLTGEGR